jgi:hypothetical protein
VVVQADDTVRISGFGGWTDLGMDGPRRPMRAPVRANEQACRADLQRLAGLAAGLLDPLPRAVRRLVRTATLPEAPSAATWHATFAALAAGVMLADPDGAVPARARERRPPKDVPDRLPAAEPTPAAVPEAAAHAEPVPSTATIPPTLNGLRAPTAAAPSTDARTSLRPATIVPAALALEPTPILGRYWPVGQPRLRDGYRMQAAIEPALRRAVWLCIAPTLDADGQPHALARRLREHASACGRLHHPHLVATLDVGVTGDETVLVIERFDGQPLAALLPKRRDWPPRRALRILQALASAIEYAHANGVAHGALGADHVYLTHSAVPKLAGLGGWTDAGLVAVPLEEPGPRVLGDALRADRRSLGVLAELLLEAPPPSLRELIERARNGDAAGALPDAVEWHARLTAARLERATVPARATLPPVR